jgi:hypothetical protein
MMFMLLRRITLLGAAGMLLIGTAVAQLSGTYTVGASGTYATIAAAISALNTGGVNGPVVFSLTDAAYSETGANLVINVTTNAPTATNTVTFKPAAGVSPVVTITGCDATNYSAFMISGTSYITIDGSNTSGGTTKDLTFNLNDATNGRRVLYVTGNSDYLTIKNSVFQITAGITGNAGATTTTVGILVYTTTSAVSDSLTILNNTISNSPVIPYLGIYLKGGSAASRMSNAVIQNNIIYARVTSITAQYASVVTDISGNTISTPLSPYGSTGISCSYLSGIANVYNNIIATLSNASTSTTSSAVTGILTSNIKPGTVFNIYNNMISDLAINLNTSGTVAGISLGDTATYLVYQNSIVIPSLSYLPAAADGILSKTTVSTTLKNNIIVNNYDNSVAYGIYKSSTGTLVSNYNDISIPTTSGNVGYYSSAQQSLSAWQTASSQDANSKSVAVTFASSTNLHLSGSSVGDHSLIGTAGLGITTDIDGETRSTGYPYIGADEGETEMPVELTSFAATTTTDGCVQIAWKTATETNSYGFAIERKKLSASWQQVTFLAGNGTSSASHAYQYIDTVAGEGTYLYRLKQIDNDGTYKYSSETEVTLTSIKSFALLGNYPNPFNPSTIIRYQLPQASHVSLKVYNILGREVASLVNDVQDAGDYSVQFNTSKWRLASGVYFYTLQAGNFSKTQKLLLVK